LINNNNNNNRDPLNMLDGVDQDRFDRLRYVEIKHGRKLIKLIIISKSPYHVLVPENVPCKNDRNCDSKFLNLYFAQLWFFLFHFFRTMHDT
jgi:hypothetical protein